MITKRAGRRDKTANLADLHDAHRDKTDKLADLHNVYHRGRGGSGRPYSERGSEIARIDDLEKRIEALEERLDLLAGKQRGPITMTEARLACERGDKATVQRYLRQFEKEGHGKDGSGAGESIKT